MGSSGNKAKIWQLDFWVPRRQGSGSSCVRNERGLCPPIHAGRPGAGKRLEAPRRGLGASALGGRGNVTSESPRALTIPKHLRFVPGSSPLTHWLPVWESPDQPAGFSLPLGASWKRRQLLRTLSSSGVCPARLLRGNGCWVPGSSEAVTSGVKRKQAGLTPRPALTLPTGDQVCSGPGASELLWGSGMALGQDVPQVKPHLSCPGAP